MDKGSRSSLWAVSSTALIVQFVLQALIGLFLQTIYVPNLAGAHPTVEELRSGVTTALWQGAHYWGSQVLLLHAILHLVAMVWSGRYRYKAEFLACCLLALCAFLFQVTGNALPMDRHDVQTVVIESGVARSLPVFGPQLGDLMLQGDRFNQETLTVWFEAHRMYVAVAAGLGLVLLMLGRKGRAEKGSWMASLLPVLAVALLAWLVPPPAGDQGVLADFDSHDAVVGWYSWPIHGALKAFSTISPTLGWVGAAVLPGLLSLFLLVLAVRGSKFDATKARLALGAFALVFLGSALLFGGPFSPLTGNQDPPKAEPTRRGKVAAIDNALAKRGQDAFNAGACVGCHGKDGAGGSAPSLRTVYRKHPDADWFKRFIRDPKSIRPGTIMPAFKDLSDADLAAIAEFLRMPK